MVGIYSFEGISTNVNATYNWWGTTDTQAINQTIHDNKNDFNLGTVEFVPFLTAPNPEAMPNPNAPIPTPPAPTSTQSPSASPKVSRSPSSSPSQAEANTTSSLSAELISDGIVTVVIVAVAVGAFLLGKRAERKSTRSADYQI